MAIWNERIKHRRTELGITLAQIAEQLGVTEATAQRYESGSIKSIPYDYICLYSKILKVSPSYIMGWDDYYSDEITELAHEMPKDKLLMDLYFYWQQLSDVGKRKLIDNASDLAKIYQKENQKST